MGNLLFEKTLNTKEELVLEKLEQWNREIPNKAFIYYGEDDKTLTFKQFNEITNAMANNLISKGVNEGDRIALFLENSYISALAMFAIWKAKAIFCPINFNYKGNLLTYQMNDLNAKYLITETSKLPTLLDVQDEIGDIDLLLHEPVKGEHDYVEIDYPEGSDIFPVTLFNELTEGNTRRPDRKQNYFDIANIIYTSGTTGPAKGAVQPYRWMHAYTYFLREFDTQEDVIYNDLPLYHTGGAIANVVRAAFLGATVSLWDKFSPNDFWQRIEQTGASNAILLDVMIPWLMKEEPTENDRHNTLNRVHLQPLPEYHHEFAKRFGIDFVSAGYSQTESANSTVVIFDELADGAGTPEELFIGNDREKTKAIAEKYNIPFVNGGERYPRGMMGVPTPYFDVTILNENDEACDIEVPGQIALRPKYPSVMMYGYYQKHGTTVEEFRNLWFHTGDTGYVDESGIFYFVDRMNDVIRIRGENISSYQIEDMINQYEGVRACTAFPMAAKEGEEDDLAVYVVLKSEEYSSEQFEKWLQQTMPNFMMPNYIRYIDELPKTATNKIEKYKLKQALLAELSIE